MNFVRKTLLKAILSAYCWLASNGIFAQTPTYAIVPLPAKLETQTGSFTLPLTVSITLEKEGAGLRLVASQLADQLAKATGQRPPVGIHSTAKRQGIHFALDKKASSNREAYTLSVTPDRIVITAGQPEGFFYGVQSLLQLMPVEIFSPTLVSGVRWTVPCCRIDDQPCWSGVSVPCLVSNTKQPRL